MEYLGETRAGNGEVFACDKALPSCLQDRKINPVTYTMLTKNTARDKTQDMARNKSAVDEITSHACLMSTGGDPSDGVHNLQYSRSVRRGEGL